MSQRSPFLQPFGGGAAGPLGSKAAEAARVPGATPQAVLDHVRVWADSKGHDCFCDALDRQPADALQWARDVIAEQRRVAVSPERLGAPAPGHLARLKALGCKERIVTRQQALEWLAQHDPKGRRECKRTR